MAKEFVTGLLDEADIDQVIITRSKDIEGNVVIRVRSNVRVVITNKLDPLDKESINIPINSTVNELSVGPQVLAIRNAILTLVRTKI